VLDLPAETRALIADRVNRCARGPFFRFPNVRLNQINWNCELYAYAATVTGDTELLRNDYRLQVERFCAGIKHPLKSGGSPNLGPGYRFHYLPAHPPSHPYNLDSAEYANETCHFIAFYEQALRAGMEPLPPGRLRLLRAWIEHIVYAYWTHAGYLNWDTGYGFKRWHAGRTWAFAQQGLLAIAAAPRFHATSQLGPWSKYFFDQGLRLYERLSRDATDGKGIAPSNLYSIEVAPLGPSIREMFAARMQANAARAVVLGLGSMAASKPPALYSLDSDIGRLSVTTPTYSTTVLAVNQRAVPYGGTELARLYDSEQRVAANVGGRPPASFGVLVRDGSAKPILISQRARDLPPAQPPLELLQSPRGRVSVAKRYPRRPYGGPFERLVARGRSSSRQVSVETTHRFEPSWIQTHWAVWRKVRRKFTVDVLFPSWGSTGTIEAVLAGGRRITLAGPGQPRRRVSLTDVAYFYVAGEETGYVVVPVDRPRRAVAHVVRPRKQSSAPRPGPTLALQIARHRRFNRLGLTTRIAPASSKDEAARAYRRLRRVVP
jgi:hypothetical protein